MCERRDVHAHETGTSRSDPAAYEENCSKPWFIHIFVTTAPQKDVALQKSSHYSAEQ